MTIRTLCIGLALGALSVGACTSDETRMAGDAAGKREEAAAVAATKPQPPAKQYDGQHAKPGAPFHFAYKIIGTPVVGSPLTIQLDLTSVFGPRSVTIDYRIHDAGALLLAESQPARVDLQPADNESRMQQQVTIVPQREGRHYLNVSATVQGENGSNMTVASIPIQVGEGGRVLVEQGRLETDDSGETVRVLSGN